MSELVWHAIWADSLYLLPFVTFNFNILAPPKLALWPSSSARVLIGQRKFRHLLHFICLVALCELWLWNCIFIIPQWLYICISTPLLASIIGKHFRSHLISVVTLPWISSVFLEDTTSRWFFCLMNVKGYTVPNETSRVTDSFRSEWRYAPGRFNEICLVEALLGDDWCKRILFSSQSGEDCF
jgi:hypothetical protein